MCKVGIIDIDEQEKVIVFGVPNEFILIQVKKYFSKPLKESVNAVYNEQFGVKFIVYQKFSSKNDLLLDLKKLLNVKEIKKSQLSVENTTIKRQLSEYFGILFDPKFTFDSFVV